MISELCLCDLGGTVEVVLRHEGLIEAPNWHPEGFLLVNGEGRLYRVPLSAPSLERVETGFAQRLNNDHGLSPCGQWIALSDHTGGEGACIYRVPVGGGTPERVTPERPSWWHGWSPDGARMAYAGARGNRVVRLFTCAVDGSDEVPLAGGFDHADGPDYSADGQWIWFNGEKDGRVDLWRQHPDGSGLERMTEGETVDWFPHPSPDGRHVVFLAYPAGTEGHPAGCDVALMLMPAEGGVARVLTRLHGGQGTLNVPSWEAGGRRFAFMRYVA
jgi:Tol biopolymer transport system component